MNKILLFIAAFIILSCSKDDTTDESKNEKILEIYHLSTSVVPENGGAVTGVSESYNEGEEVIITATPEEDFEFKEWKGDINGSENPITFEMSSDKVVVAVFEKIVNALEFDIIGKWYIQNSRGNNSSTFNNKINKQSDEGVCNVYSIEFREDGTYILIINGDETNGRFVVIGNNSIDLGVGNLDDLSFVNDVLSFTINLDSGCSSTVAALLLTYVPNDAFEKELIRLGQDNTLDNFVKTETIRTVSTLKLEPVQEITDFTGIEDFRDLEVLDVMIYNYSSDFLQTRPEVEIDLTSNLKLKYLDLYGVGVKSLNLENNQLLERVFLYYSELSGAISFPNNPLLREVAINENYPQPRVNIDLDFTHNPNLELFSSDETWIGKMDISRSPNMKVLSIMEYVDELIMSGIYDKMSTLQIIGSSPYRRPINMNAFPNLEIIKLTYELPLSFAEYSGLKELYLSYNRATTIDLSQNTGLYNLNLGMTELSELNLANNKKLTYFLLNAPISNLDINNNTELRSISLYDTNIRQIDISKTLNLETLHMINYYDSTLLQCVKVSEEQKRKIENGQYSNWNIGEAEYSLNCN